mmetsp:Transcript_8718/g.18555  ORF Transcript_8718/g.18555 Transcript_8718/m.18555 type:complete len:584 (-) Transcript_8718:244-1995(-)
MCIVTKVEHLNTMDDQWALHGEGNANVVLSYVGASPQLSGFVLRVSKRLKKQGSPAKLQLSGDVAKSDTVPAQPATATHADSLLNDLVEDAIWQGILPAIASTGAAQQSISTVSRQTTYIQHHLGPILGEQYINVGVPVQLPPGAAKALRDVGFEAQDGQPCMLLRDQTSLKSVAPPAGFEPCSLPVCVEIKPKSGVLPALRPPGLLPRLPVTPAARLKAVVPRYPMHQLLKREAKQGTQQQGSTDQQVDLSGLSLYNPLDLFSREPKSVERAVRALLDEPSNNLRIFIDGKLVYGGRPDAESLSAVYDRPGLEGAGHVGVPASGAAARLPPALAALEPTLRQVLTGEGASSSTSGVDLLVHILCEVLVREALLSNVQSAQKMDALGVEAALHMYNRLLSEVQKEQGSRAGSTAQQLQPAWPRVHPGWSDLWTRWPRNRLVGELRDYITSATAKDCGVMIAVQQLQQARTAPQPHAGAASAAGAAGPSSTPLLAGGVVPSLQEAVKMMQPKAAQLLQLSCTPKEEAASQPQASFMYQVGLVDLDPKPAAKIPIHYQTDVEVTECALRNLNVLQAMGYDTHLPG